MTQPVLIRDGQGRIDSPEVAEDAIRRLVFTFYSSVQDDALLGPVFERHLHGRWGPHLRKMCDFWSSVLIGTGRYRGDPIGAHLAVSGVSRAHFDRWMQLFVNTAKDLLAESDAEEIVGRAVRIRAVLEHHMETADMLAGTGSRRLPESESG